MDTFIRSLELMVYVGRRGQSFFSTSSCPVLVAQPLTAAPIRYVVVGPLLASLPPGSRATPQGYKIKPFRKA